MSEERETNKSSLVRVDEQGLTTRASSLARRGLESLKKQEAQNDVNSECSDKSDNLTNAAEIAAKQQRRELEIRMEVSEWFDQLNSEQQDSTPTSLTLSSVIPEETDEQRLMRVLDEHYLNKLRNPH